MSDAPTDPVEAEARRLLRELITRLPWFPRLSADERAKRIEEDVDRWWLLMIEEAAERLADSAPLEPTACLSIRGFTSAETGRKGCGR